MTKVDVGVPCYGTQYSSWWGWLLGELLSLREAGIEVGQIRAVTSALPDHNKSNLIDNREGVGGRWAQEHQRANLTDANRSKITGAVAGGGKPGGFLSGDAEWLWMLDDDIIPPDGALLRLLQSGHSFIGGVCYLGQKPHNVTAYLRSDDGWYDALMGYELGTLMQVDSIGMGCTLIHRSVFEKILADHVVFERSNGSLVPVHKSQIKNRHLPGKDAKPMVENGYLRTPVHPVSPDDNRPWPFFSMEYGRTEDHHFCELAAAVGIRPWLDTNIQTAHLKPKPIDRKVYLEQLAKMDLKEPDGSRNGRRT